MKLSSRWLIIHCFVLFWARLVILTTSEIGFPLYQKRECFPQLPIFSHKWILDMKSWFAIEFVMKLWLWNVKVSRFHYFYGLNGRCARCFWKVWSTQVSGMICRAPGIMIPRLKKLRQIAYIYSHVSSFLFVNSFFPHHCFAVRNVSFFPCTQSCCGFRLGTSGLERTGVGGIVW